MQRQPYPDIQTVLDILRQFFDGTFIRQNDFYTGEEIKLSIILYVNDFEVCNPLGTSRKKHKITAVYWVLANVPSHLQTALTSIHLGLLCKSVNVKQFEYKAILEPLLKDLATLQTGFQKSWDTKQIVNKN